MGLNIGAILATLSLDSGGFKRGFMEAEAVTATFGSTFATAVTNPVLGAITLFKQFGAAVLSSSNQLLGMAEGVARTSALTGVSVETIQSMRNALADMGLSAEGADAAMIALNRKLGDAKKDGGATAKSLAQLGVDITNIGVGEPAVRAIFDQLYRIQDVGIRAAAAAEVMDRQFGPQLLSAVSGGAKGIDELNAKFLGLGRTLDANVIGSLDAMDGRVDQLKGRLEGMKNVLTAEFLQGLVGGLGSTDDEVNSLATSLKNELGPAAKELGVTMAAVVISMRELIEYVNKLKSIDDKAKATGPLSAVREFADWNLRRGWEQIEAATSGDLARFGRSLYSAPPRGDNSTGLSR